MHIVDDRSDHQETGAAADPGPVSSRTLIVVAVIVAALLRTAWALRHGLALDQEGVEYARIAQNLLAGRGFVGMLNNGTQLNFAPLYPIMIAGLSILLGSAALAARVISIAFGAALVIPTFKIAERLYGRRAAEAAAALVVFHPVLIAGAASTYAEGPYLTLLMSGLLWLMCWATSRRVRNSIAAGVLFGLAYLVRPEAFVLVGVFVVGGVLIALLEKDRRPVWFGTLGLAVAFTVVAAPNIVFLTRSTGTIRIEAKGTLAYQWGQKINEGMTYQEGAYGIGPDLSERGVYMKPYLAAMSSARITPGQYVAYLATSVQRNRGEIQRTIVDEPALGCPILFALVVIGLFGSRWDRRRIALEGTLLATAGTMVLILLSVQQIWFRFFYPLLGPLLLWGAKGADDLGEWGRAVVASLWRDGTAAAAGGALVKWTSIGLLCVVSLRAVPDLAQFKDSLFGDRVRAGRWLAAQAPPHKWVMDMGNQVAYYAGGDLLYLPYATSDLALRYIAKRKPDYVVLMGAPKNYLPYTAEWYDRGIPDRRAVLVYDDSTSAEEGLKIYRWVADSAATSVTGVRRDQR